MAYGQPESCIELEYRFGLLTEATHAPNIVNQFFVPGTGTSAEHTFRLCYEHEIALLGSGLSLDGGLGFAYSIGNFSSDPFPGSSEQFTLQYNSISAYVRAGVNIPISDVILGLDGWLGVPLTRSLTESLVTNGSSSVVASNTAIEYSRLPVGLRVEVNYFKHLFSALPITGGLFGELDLDAYRQIGFKATSGGITFRWNFEQLIGGSVISPE
jgi:hypothetical protein